MKHLLFILGLALLASCGDPAPRKLAIASEVMRERPDSALAILATIDPDRLDADSLRASYAYTRGWVNVLQHRSLVTDTLLPAAVSYYRTSGDTLRWALATRLQAARLWGIDLRDSAIAILDSTNRLIYGGQGKWELMRQKLEFDHSARRYADAIADLDWLICHTPAIPPGSSTTIISKAPPSISRAIPMRQPPLPTRCCTRRRRPRHILRNGAA